ncbi:hypothetical protein MBLNU457_6332t1 [Dothideomycetes sp. NU457]
MTHSRNSHLIDEDHYLKYGRHSNRLQQSEPLINRVTNAWKEKSDFDISEEALQEDLIGYREDFDDGDDCLDTCRSLTRSRRYRRKMFWILAIIAAIYTTYRIFLKPSLDENELYMQGLDKEFSGFGNQWANQFKEIKQIEELDVKKIPGGSEDPEGKKRLVFVGDIHGCRPELDKLLEKVGFDGSRDHLIAVGDNVAKGPDTAGVIDRLIELKASSVRGNWEDKVLLSERSYRRTGEGLRDYTRQLTEEHRVLDSLKKHHLSFLESLPLILHIPAIKPSQATPPTLSQNSSQKKNLTHPILTDIYTVHAGLVPAIPPTRQDPYSVMNMRAIYPLTHSPSANRKYGVAWEKIWNWYQDRLARGKRMPVFAYIDPSPPTSFDDGQDHTHDLWDYGAQNAEMARQRGWWFWIQETLGTERVGEGWRRQRPSTIVYGHDSKRGLNLKRWSKGLDSSCVKGGQLTALVLDAWGRQDLVQVDCAGYQD